MKSYFWKGLPFASSSDSDSTFEGFCEESLLSIITECLFPLFLFYTNNCNLTLISCEFPDDPFKPELC